MAFLLSRLRKSFICGPRFTGPPEGGFVDWRKNFSVARKRDRMPKSPRPKEQPVKEPERLPEPLKEEQEQLDLGLKPPPKKVVEFSPEAGTEAAFSTLHAKEAIVHHDMKPRSIMKVTAEGKQKVLDFSIAEAPALNDWNNMCAALAEDALLDETPPGGPEDVDRFRKRMAQLIESHRRGD